MFSQIHYTLGEIAKQINAELQGDPALKITGIASLHNAKPGQVSFLLGSRYQLVATSRHEKKLLETKASAIVLQASHAAKCPVDKLIVENPYESYVKLANLFIHEPKRPPEIHASAIIGKHCQIHPSASIGPNVVLEDRVSIGANTVINSGCHLGDDVNIGSDCVVYANVTIYHETKIGNRVEIHSGAVIGSDGFGLYRNQNEWNKIPQIGRVVIGNDVLVGANTSIDRGTIDDTIIEDGVKLDNLVQIAHNVFIGANTVIAGCTGIAGSTRIGKNCMIAGAVGVADNIEITDNVILTGMASVRKSISQPGIYSSGLETMPHQQWQKQVVRFKHLDEIARRLRNLENDHHE